MTTPTEEARDDIWVALHSVWGGIQEPERKNARAINARSFLRILLFDAFCLRLLFIPVGVRRGISHHRVKDGLFYWEYQQIHVFGIRVARWVLGPPRFWSDKEEAKVATASVTATWAHVEDPEKEPAEEKGYEA